MSDRSDTWMPFYVGDYLSATGRLTTEQHGAYLLILIDYWKNGPPPNDDAVLAALARLSPTAWKKAKAALIGFFEVRDGLLIQKRVEKERDRASTITDERSKAGKAGAAKRWQKDSKPIANAIPLPLANEQQNDGPSQSPSSDTDVSGAEAPADPLKELFDLGISVLTASGKTEREARSLIGKWRKAKSDGEVLTGLIECRTRAISDPVEWLQKRFQSARWVSASGYEYRGSNADVLREAERRGDNNTYWSVKVAMRKEAEAKAQTPKPKPSKGQRSSSARPIGDMISGLVSQHSGNA